MKEMRDLALEVMIEDYKKNSIVVTKNKKKNKRNTKDQFLLVDKKITKRKNIVKDHHKQLNQNDKNLVNVSDRVKTEILEMN